MTIEISEKLFKDIEKYCELNGLNINEYVEGLLKKSFTIEKYGDRPVINKSSKPKQVKEEKSVKNSGTNKEKEIIPPFQLTDAVVDYSKTEELKPVPPMITHEEIVEEEVKPQKKLKRKLN